jgi:hypothetical protein
MNPFSKASSSNSSGNPHAWNAPACSPKLSTALEKLISECLIDLIPNDKALVPSEHAILGPDEWDGSFGLQKGMKIVKLGSGREVRADFVFIGIGNRSNVELVEEADDSALADGQIWVDDYLRVCQLDEIQGIRLTGIGEVFKSSFSAGAELLRYRRLLFDSRVEDDTRRSIRCSPVRYKVGPLTFEDV